MKFIVDNWLLIAVALGSGGLLLWPMVRGASSGGGLSVQGAVQLINRERGVLIDLREPAEFAAGHPIGARNVPLAQLEARLPATVKNKGVPVLLICDNGGRAQRAAAQAKKLGYAHAQAVAGGLKSWKEANLPVEKV